MLVAVQLSVPGLYLPPLFSGLEQLILVNPPQTIISLSVHTAVCDPLVSGTLVVLVGVQLSLPGSYLAPVAKLP